MKFYGPTLPDLAWCFLIFLQIQHPVFSTLPPSWDVGVWSPEAEYVCLHLLQLDVCGSYLENLEKGKLYFRGSFHSYKQLRFNSEVISSVKRFQTLWAVESPFSVPQWNGSKCVIIVLSAVCNVTQKFPFRCRAPWKQEPSLPHA